MPNPAIPRSTSDPFLSSSSKSKTQHRVTPSTRSTCSGSRSSKSSYWQAWSNVNKLGSLISIRRRSNDSSHSDLTEESLEAHNKRQAAIFQTEVVNNAHQSLIDDRNAKCSPYYKGLTDYSLILNRERFLSPAAAAAASTSPGRESHATTIATTSSSFSSFVLVKMQEWTSCFNKSSKQNNTNAPAPVPVPVPVPVMAASLAPAEATAGVEQGQPSCSYSSSWEKKKESGHKNVLSVISEEKPLRERVSSSESNKPSTLSPPPPQPQPPPPPVCRTSNIDEKKEKIINTLIERKFTWADKYRPKALKDFICHKATVTKVQDLFRDIDCNHFIFEGPAGVGKRTMIWAMMQEAYGPDRIQTREECKSFKMKGESVGSIEVRIKVSSQHIEVNLCDFKGYEKHVIIQLIKETNNNRISKNGLHSITDSCKAIILYNADKLSADAVLYIKWLLERYKGSNRFFFCCNEVSKLRPIKELCTSVQLSLPSDEEIVEVLEFIAKQEGIELPHQFAKRIAITSKNNLRQAIRSLEASRQRSYPFTEDQVILTGWEDDIANIAKDMIQEQSPKQLYIISGKLQNLIEHDVAPDFIFDTLVLELKNNLDEVVQGQLDSLYKDYNRKDGNMLECENQLLFLHSRHEEAEFIAKFMSQYKLHITTNKSMQHDSGT
ncbi:replication factor C subunit 3 [Jatropha curcas]|uniref:replication factor C subunit 3 n=1 Tax=Jatropha curcas TaxID=180498 RepID=UPI0005FBDECF|nr:replication factor C subunit 3 [Jatropha curcas]